MTQTDAEIIEHMKLRELNMKHRQVTANKIFRMQKRVRQVTMLVLSLVSSVALLALFLFSPLDVHDRLQYLPKVDVLIFFILLWIF